MNFKSQKILFSFFIFFALFAISAYANPSVTQLVINPATSAWQNGSQNVTFNFTMTIANLTAPGITNITIDNGNFTMWNVTGLPIINITGWNCSVFNTTRINCSNSTIAASNFNGGIPLRIDVYATTNDSAQEINHTWRTTANNLNNVLSTANTTNTQVDGQNPRVSSLTVNDSNVKHNDTILINVTVVDTNVANVTARNSTNITLSSIGSNVYQVNTTPYNLGCAIDAICNVTLQANDTFTHSNYSIVIQVTVDDTAPSVAMTVSSSVAVSRDLTTSCTATDTNTITKVFEITKPDSTKITDKTCGDTLTFDASGDYVLKFTGTDPAGNIGTVSKTVTVYHPQTGGSGGGGGGSSTPQQETPAPQPEPESTSQPTPTPEPEPVPEGTESESESGAIDRSSGSGAGGAFTGIPGGQNTVLIIALLIVLIGGAFVVYGKQIRKMIGI